MRSATKFLKEKFGNNKLIGVELGVEDGIYSVEINSFLNMKELYLIDVWGEYIQEGIIWNYEHLYWNVKLKFQNNQNVKIIKGDSIEIVSQFKNNILDFVYIDGNHQYEFVKKDINVWYQKIKIGGYICGHDYTLQWKGVMQAVDEFAKEHNLKFNFKQDDEISTDWWIEKC